MQKLSLGGDELTLVASPLTPWIYKKAFGEDMISEIAAMQDAILPSGSVDMGAIGLFGLVQMAWAMAKTAEPGRIPDFESWLEGLDELDYSELEVGPILSELQRGFFRRAKGDTAAEDTEADTE